VRQLQHRLHETLGLTAGLRPHQDRELRAAHAKQAGARAGLADQLGKVARRRLENQIARLVPEAVYHQPEPVDRNQNQRDIRTGGCAMSGFGNLFLKPETVGQAGQRVVKGLMQQLALGILTFSDVRQVDVEDPDIGHRMYFALKHPPERGILAARNDTACRGRGQPLGKIGRKQRGGIPLRRVAGFQHAPGARIGVKHPPVPGNAENRRRISLREQGQLPPCTRLVEIGAQ
jgi:hypothetical protein